jgi:hypothetical protein
MFLVISVAVLGPAVGLMNTYQDMIGAESSTPGLVANPLWGTLKTILWFDFSLTQAFGICAAGLLVGRMKSSTPFCAMILLWAKAAIAPFVTFYLLRTFVNEEVGSATWENLQQHIVVYGVVASIWSAYLWLSRRVKNTYGRGGVPPLGIPGAKLA